MNFFDRDRLVLQKVQEAYDNGFSAGLEAGYKKGYEAPRQQGLSDEYFEACQGLEPRSVARRIREHAKYQERLVELGEIEVTFTTAVPPARYDEDPDWPV